MLIQHDGRIFWRGREVESDDDFRAAMLDVAKYLQSSAQGSVPMLAYNALLAEVEGLRALADSWDSRHKYGSCCCDDKARECAEELRAALAPKAPA
jgi:hypothetical protein